MKTSTEENIATTDSISYVLISTEFTKALLWV